MRIIANSMPDGLPVLEAGRHPDPAAGGCFMEYASLLAGERWSDHPRCTHPALAELARLINDASSREDRQQLAMLIPDVVGLAGPDPQVAPALVLLCLDAMPAAGRRRRACRVQRRWAAHRLAAAATGGTGARRWQVTDRIYRFGPMRHAMARAVRAMGCGARGAARRRQLFLGAIATTKNLTTEPERAHLQVSRSTGRAATCLGRRGFSPAAWCAASVLRRGIRACRSRRAGD